MLTIMGVGLVLALVAWLATRGPSEGEIFRRFDALDGFTITERHAHDGTGIAADEARGLVAVVGKGLGGRPPVLLAAKDLTAWRYQAKDQHFEMTLRARRLSQPLVVSFRKRATADEWLKIFRNIVEGR
ncbi:hypothetical protein [Nitrospirillum sp. BR 11828]|uniref:hypothetical protein n=1 Tax=Nitrospirillum sp. BR 11828 TaxID=3104325 RepID=UPI002ACA9555|nr:hypothetical protein [Nitrospirillum sp. BR 11828]MDZ5647426.1 hypothetical protein [Nitrospirillum sp. BR 11828]